MVLVQERDDMDFTDEI